MTGLWQPAREGLVGSTRCQPCLPGALPAPSQRSYRLARRKACSSCSQPIAALGTRVSRGGVQPRAAPPLPSTVPRLRSLPRPGSSPSRCRLTEPPRQGARARFPPAPFCSAATLLGPAPHLLARGPSPAAGAQPGTLRFPGPPAATRSRPGPACRAAPRTPPPCASAAEPRRALTSQHHVPQPRARARPRCPGSSAAARRPLRPGNAAEDAGSRSGCKSGPRSRARGRLLTPARSGGISRRHRNSPRTGSAPSGTWNEDSSSGCDQAPIHPAPRFRCSRESCTRAAL